MDGEGLWRCICLSGCLKGVSTRGVVVGGAGSRVGCTRLAVEQRVLQTQPLTEH